MNVGSSFGHCMLSKYKLRTSFENIDQDFPAEWTGIDKDQSPNGFSLADQICYQRQNICHQRQNERKFQRNFQFVSFFISSICLEALYLIDIPVLSSSVFNMLLHSGLISHQNFRELHLPWYERILLYLRKIQKTYYCIATVYLRKCILMCEILSRAGCINYWLKHFEVRKKTNTVIHVHVFRES